MGSNVIKGKGLQLFVYMEPHLRTKEVSQHILYIYTMPQLHCNISNYLKSSDPFSTS